jgi:hypothetical protein
MLVEDASELARVFTTKTTRRSDTEVVEVLFCAANTAIGPSMPSYR